VSDECLVFSPEAEDALARQVMTNADELLDWEEADYLHYVRTDLVERLRRRVQRYIDEGHEPNPEQLLVLQMEDFDITSYINMQETEEEPSSSEVLYLKSMTELDAMVGLSSLKAQLTKDFALMRFYEERRRMGLPAESGASHHMLFTGNPGTGKTTVARLIGKIYHAMGYLTKGEDISVDRTQLVGAHIGETEENMLNVLKRAKGNVLFIDEAYTLCDSTYDRRDFGYHVVEALLPVMADPHPDMIIIFAGYANEMERLMQVNQGLKGRFTHHLHFDDYTADELMQICDNLFVEHQYTLTDEARTLLISIIKRMVQHKDRYFCNARWMKQFVESGILPAMASRVMQLPHVSLDHALLTIIEVTDVEAAECLYAPCQVEVNFRPRIGFVA
jgi:SpoVK/Ycf46/Vps4 family AAA+-type ATPase